MNKLEREGPLTLTYQLTEELRKLIMQYKAGELFLSDKEISAKYGVSVITVRNAVEYLVSEGLLIRRRGKGTFLTDKKISSDITTLQSGTELFRSHGIESSIELIAAEQVEADQKLSRYFGTAAEAGVYKLVRVRKIAQIPYSIETNYFTTDICKDIIHLYHGNSLYDFLKKQYDICVLRSHETYSAIVLDEAHAALLGQKKRSPAIHLEGLVYDQYDRLLSVEECFYRADKYEIVVEAKAGQPRATQVLEGRGEQGTV